MSGVKLLGNCTSLNSMASNYLLSQDIHQIATNVVEGESIPIIYISILDKTIEGCLERKHASWSTLCNVGIL